MLDGATSCTLILDNFPNNVFNNISICTVKCTGVMYGVRDS